MEQIFCSVQNCHNVSRTKGLCPTHYQQQTRGYGDRPAAKTDPNGKCAVSHCSNAANSSESGAYCERHYQLKWRGIDPETRIVKSDLSYAKKCWVESCPNRADTRSLCNRHARAARAGRLEVPASLGVKLNDPCAFEGCDRPYITKKLCHAHYEQLRQGRKLSAVRDWGKYNKGEHICALDHCRKVAISSGLCGSHSTLTSKYGLTTDELVQVWTNPVCSNPGCGETKRLHMDHSHESGKFRALLCSPCNTALGFLKENPDRIRGLATYIERF